MSEQVSDGGGPPSTLTIVLIAAVAVPVVLVVILWLIGSGSGTPKSSLPDLQHKGLQWAEAEAKKAGYERIDAYDALGRGRGWRDSKQWQVCFQYPPARTKPTKATVQLAAVKTTESCPPTDQGRYEPAGAWMPDLINRTAYMAGKMLGANASVRFLRKDGTEVTRGLGDWRVCQQSPKPTDPFDGVPVTTVVVPYEQRC